VDVCYHENLHTKLYLSEKCGIITSMNLYDYSMKSNEEIGFYTEDKELLDKLNGYVKELLPNCGEFHVPWKSSDSKPERMGICIRCGENEVPFQIFVSPSLCDECFTIWKKYGENPEYPENYCLGCRKKHKTSVKRPLCKDCTYDRMWGVESDDDEFVVQESELNLEEKYFGDEPQK